MKKIDLKNDDLPIIIFGAGIVGEVMYQACLNAGIKIACFCDNNMELAKGMLYGIRIIHTSNLKSEYKSAVFLISVFGLNDVVDQLQMLGYTNWYGSNMILRDFDISPYNWSKPFTLVEYAVTKVIIFHENCFSPDKLFCGSVDLIITERCSLKCRDCCNLMRYYQNPIDCDFDEIMFSIDRFLSIVDGVYQIGVLGGETFMNKNNHLIINRLANEPKIQKVLVFTNGTIALKEGLIPYYKNDKILFFITDYDSLSKNLEKLIQQLNAHNIAYYLQKASSWTDCATIIKHNRTIDEQKMIFKTCHAKQCTILAHGKLYRCLFSSSTSSLQAVPDYKSDYIDILDETKEIFEIKMDIKKNLSEKEVLEVCDFCNGRSFGDSEIKPAIQADYFLEYQRYFGNK